MNTRLDQAMTAFLRFRHEGGSRGLFLDQHPDLRDLLEPMLADDPAGDGPAGDGRAGDGVSGDGEVFAAAEAGTGTVLGGDFRLEREVGRGGNGVVFAALQLSLGRRVAVKVLLRHLTLAASTIVRFRREAKTIAALNHPCIVRVLAVGADRDTYWFAMEFVEGRSLAAHLAELRERGEPPAQWTRRMVQLTAHIADALHHVHELGIVHRDVKPSNVLLRANGSPVLTDFGLAHDASAPSLTLPGGRSGTPCYMAPEQISGAADEVDARSDIFALGASLYEMLTFERAFDAGTPDLSMRRVVNDEPVDVRKRNVAVSRDLAGIVATALDKDPNRRYQTAAAFAEDLRAYLTHRPVRARQAGSFQRLVRWARRQPLKAGFVATLACGVPAVAALVTLLGTGDLAVRMHVQTELLATSDPDGGHRFGNEFGEVRYGRAEAFDASGSRTAVGSTLRDGVLELTVPAAFHDRAVFPLTIDPTLLVFQASTGTAGLARRDADVAYLGTWGGVHAVVYEEAYSLLDHDVWLGCFDLAGAPLGGGYVDFTTENWRAPRIASNRSSSQFLVVATRGLSITQTSIQARTIGFGGTVGGLQLAFGSPFAVHGIGGAKNPDVGGDPNPNGPLPGNYCVTWEGQTNGELYYNIVRTDGSLAHANGVWLNPTTEAVSRPSISKSCGTGALAAREWLLVWQLTYSSTDEDIYGSVIGYTGSVPVQAFPIDTSTLNDTKPAVSSPTEPVAGQTRFLVTYERHLAATPTVPSHDDILAQLFTGTTSLSGAVNLTTLLQMPALRNQTNPCVDTDGHRFAVAFSQWWPVQAPDVTPFVATLHVAPGGGLGVSEYPVLLNSYAGADDHMQITSRRSGGTFDSGYLAAWDTTSTAGTWVEVNACLYAGHLALPPSAYFLQALPPCGSLALVATGVPALGNTFTLTLSGMQGWPLLMLGTHVPPIAVCAFCQLGLDLSTAVVLASTAHSITVPPEPTLMGLTFGAQGIDVLAVGGCTAPLNFTLSNEIVVTIL